MSVFLDLSAMDEDPDAPCFDGGPHSFEIDDDVIRCRRGCGAEISVDEVAADE